MNVLFIGTVEFSKHMLLTLIKTKMNIVSIITKEKSDFNSDFCDLAPIAIQNNIEYKYVKNINHENNISYIKEKQPDVIFCLGWSQLLCKEILDIPKFGVIGYHPALLPFNRGRHPIIWALVLGLEKTGSTFLKLNPKADEGEIISQKIVPISYYDTAFTMQNKLVEVAKNQLTQIVEYLIKGNLPLKKQDINKGNTWRKRCKEDGKIDWRMSSYSIYNLVRALTNPYPGAYTLVNGKEVNIWKVEEVEFKEKNVEPGKILKILSDGTVIVKTGENAVRILEPLMGNVLSEGEYL